MTFRMIIAKIFKKDFSLRESGTTYATCYRETLKRVKVNDVIREKDKEPVYALELNDFDDPNPTPGNLLAKHTVSKTIYESYIGDTVNAIKATEATLFIATIDPDGKPGFYKAFRTAFPWNADDAKFSDEEICSLCEAILKHHELSAFPEDFSRRYALISKYEYCEIPIWYIEGLSFLRYTDLKNKLHGKDGVAE